MLDKKQHYLQIALNSNLAEAQSIINQIPLDKRIIIEVGTPLIKAYGIKGIREIRNCWEQRVFGSVMETAQSNYSLTGLLSSLFPKKELPKKSIFAPYIVADMKCMDRGIKEVEIAKKGGANALTALGQAPIETLDAFIQKCEDYNLDAMIDMMNVEFPLSVLRELKKLPQVVIVHRGVDEEEINSEKEIPYHEIQRIKDNYDIIVAIAGGDDFQDVQRAIFNDANIVVVWKSFYQSSIETGELVRKFLKEIR